MGLLHEQLTRAAASASGGTDDAPPPTSGNVGAAAAALTVISKPYTKGDSNRSVSVERRLRRQHSGDSTPTSFKKQTSNKVEPKPPSVVVDVSVLRKALRLVHCIQRERGASCAYYSHYQQQQQMKQNATLQSVQAPSTRMLEQARRGTDRAFTMLYGIDDADEEEFEKNSLIKKQRRRRKGPIERVTLSKIRRMVYYQQSRDTPELDSSSAAVNKQQQQQQQQQRHHGGYQHQILVCFNTVIQSIVHQHVLQFHTMTRRSVIRQQQQRQRNEKNSDSKSSLAPAAAKYGGMRGSMSYQSLLAMNGTADADLTPEQQQQQQNTSLRSSRASRSGSTGRVPFRAPISSSHSARCFSSTVTATSNQLAASPLMKKIVIQMSSAAAATANTTNTSSPTLPPATILPSILGSSAPTTGVGINALRRQYCQNVVDLDGMILIPPPEAAVIKGTMSGDSSKGTFTATNVAAASPVNLYNASSSMGQSTITSKSLLESPPTNLLDPLIAPASSSSLLVPSLPMARSLSITTNGGLRTTSVQVAYSKSPLYASSRSNAQETLTSASVHGFTTSAATSMFRSSPENSTTNNSNNQYMMYYDDDTGLLLDEEDDDDRLLRLLDLLNVFVRLKEAAGVERATLTSLTATAAITNSGVSNNSSSRRNMLNDLVIQVENQRRLVSKLTKLLPKTGSWHDLVEELVVSLSPKMKELQSSILHHQEGLESFLQQRMTISSSSGTNISRSSSNDGNSGVETELWGLLTLYIDKLHSLELLTVEEIECCVGCVAPKTPYSSTTPTRTKAVTDSNTIISDVLTPLHKDCDDITSHSIDDVAVFPACAANKNSASSKPNEESKQSLGQSDHDSKSIDDSQNMSVKQILNLFDLSSSATKDDLATKVASMPADEVRKRLLALSSSSAISVIASPVSPRHESKITITGSNHSHGPVSDVDMSGVGESTGDAPESTGRNVDDLLAELSKVPASKEWEIDLYEIKFHKSIGQGNAGTTYLASWTGMNVAVKVASINEMGLDGWRTEVQALQKLHHPNIIRLLGSVYHASPLTFCLVLEYCEGGDLQKALQRITPKNFFFRVSNGVAQGMKYLHGRGVIHRDIKPSNILLEGDVASGNFTVKVTDFGVATDSTLSEDRTAETGTYRWMAPEVIRHESYSSSADMYSFGVVLWQLVTHEDPFQGTSQIEAAAAVALENRRPPFPVGCPPGLLTHIEHCWSSDPRLRPSFDGILTDLSSLERRVTPAELEFIQAPLGNGAYNPRPMVHPPDDKKKKRLRSLLLSRKK